ncbi:MAG: AbrB/MazE/SpoVT family DNA-binding domain-containing protein [Dehalococcoidia bacterium]
MNELVTTITQRGQVTVLAVVRRLLGLKTGDKLAFVIDDQGSVRLTVPHYSSVASIRGAAGSLPAPLSWDEMRRTASADRLETATQATA